LNMPEPLAGLDKFWTPVMRANTNHRQLPMAGVGIENRLDAGSDVRRRRRNVRKSAIPRQNLLEGRYDLSPAVVLLQGRALKVTHAPAGAPVLAVRPHPRLDGWPARRVLLDQSDWRAAAVGPHDGRSVALA